MQTSLKIVLLLLAVLCSSCDLIDSVKYEVPSTYTYIYTGKQVDCVMINQRTGGLVTKDKGVLDVSPLDEISVTVTPVFVPDDPQLDVSGFTTIVTALDFSKELNNVPCTVNFTIPELPAGQYPVTCRLSYNHSYSNYVYAVEYMSNTLYLNIK